MAMRDLGPPPTSETKGDKMDIRTPIFSRGSDIEMLDIGSTRYDRSADIWGFEE